MIYDLLRNREPEVEWSKEVWFTAGIPKHRFLTWLFVLNRCPTKDRMQSWGLDVDPTCVLCNGAPESRDHLFFNCPYTRVIWEPLMSRSPISSSPSHDPPSNWDEVLTALRSPSLTGTWRLLTLLVWQSTIYFCWSERNNRIHRSSFKHPDLIKKDIDKVIKLKIAAVRFSNPSLSSALFQAWTH